MSEFEETLDDVPAHIDRQDKDDSTITEGSEEAKSEDPTHISNVESEVDLPSPVKWVARSPKPKGKTREDNFYSIVWFLITMASLGLIAYLIARGNSNSKYKCFSFSKLHLNYKIKLTELIIFTANNNQFLSKGSTASTTPTLCNENVLQFGDGLCDDSLNTALCNFDGGDCCQEYVTRAICKECKCKMQGTLIIVLYFNYTVPLFTYFVQHATVDDEYLHKSLEDRGVMQTQISESMGFEWISKSTIVKQVANVESVEVCSLVCLRSGNVTTSWMFNASNYECYCFKSHTAWHCHSWSSFTMVGLYLYGRTKLLQCTLTRTSTTTTLTTTTAITTTITTTTTTTTTTTITPTTSETTSAETSDWFQEFKIAIVDMTTHQVGAWGNFNTVQLTTGVKSNGTCSRTCIELGSEANAWFHKEDTMKCFCLHLNEGEICCPSKTLINGMPGLTTHPVYFKMSQLMINRSDECFRFTPLFTGDSDDDPFYHIPTQKCECISCH